MWPRVQKAHANLRTFERTWSHDCFCLMLQLFSSWTNRHSPFLPFFYVHVSPSWKRRSVEWAFPRHFLHRLWTRHASWNENLESHDGDKRKEWRSLCHQFNTVSIELIFVFLGIHWFSVAVSLRMAKRSCWNLVRLRTLFELVLSIVETIATMSKRLVREGLHSAPFLSLIERSYLLGDPGNRRVRQIKGGSK